MSKGHLKSPPNKSDKFAKWLRAQLDRSGMTQMEFARRIGVRRGTVSRWLKPVEGTNLYRRPSTSNFLAIGEEFGVDPTMLMEMTGIEFAENESPLRNEAIRLVTVLPEDMLRILNPQIRALFNMHRDNTPIARIGPESSEKPDGE